MSRLLGTAVALKTPLYHQIALIFRQKILNGYYAIDDRLPTEKEITAEYGVSRITAKRALDDLAQEGLVVRERARGTRVSYAGGMQPVKSSVEGVLENLLAMGLETNVTLLSLNMKRQPMTLPNSLNAPRKAWCSERCAFVHWRMSRFPIW